MVDSFLEVVVLRCPNCQKITVKPSWFLELESDIHCSACKATFPAAGNETDRKMLQFALGDRKIKGVNIVWSLSGKRPAYC